MRASCTCFSSVSSQLPPLSPCQSNSGCSAKFLRDLMMMPRKIGASFPAAQVLRTGSSASRLPRWVRYELLGFAVSRSGNVEAPARLLITPLKPYYLIRIRILVAFLLCFFSESKLTQVQDQLLAAELARSSCCC